MASDLSARNEVFDEDSSKYRKRRRPGLGVVYRVQILHIRSSDFVQAHNGDSDGIMREYKKVLDDI